MNRVNKLEVGKCYDLLRGGSTDKDYTFIVLSDLVDNHSENFNYRFYRKIKVLDTTGWTSDKTEFYVKSNGDVLDVNVVVENIPYTKTREFEQNLKDLIDE